MDQLNELRQRIDTLDREMADLFCRRMEASAQVADYKRKAGLPVLDRKREAEILSRNGSALPKQELLPFYTAFQRRVMEISRQYQTSLIGGSSAACFPDLGYEIILSRGALTRISDYFDLNRNVMIITDSGVPTIYGRKIAEQCRHVSVFTLPCGEASKSISCLRQLLEEMLRFGLTRQDCVVAVGGGMVGDLTGLAAALYMRGIDFYNVPTTLLAQVDSAIGGKTAVNLDGVKNAAGAFYRPKAVLIDPALLKTLYPRQLSAGMAEVVKMALICDAELFSLIETNAISRLDELIGRSLQIKAKIVAADETEHGLRRVLNFGHTIGHAIEATHPELLHGECVALGMLPMCSPSVRDRLKPVLQKLELPTSCVLDRPAIYGVLSHDKKSTANGITVTEVVEVGHYNMRQVSPEELMARLDIIEEGAFER